MTANRRAKRDARDRQTTTGEPYVAARRRTAKTLSRQFEPDHCANCMAPLPEQVERLFCSGRCRQTADLIRYWRGISRDGRIDQADVKAALNTRIAMLLGGGYPEQARRLPPAVRDQVWDRDQGKCCICGADGDEIDHINGNSPSLSNLQLLCAPCHHQKTQAAMIPASVEQHREIETLRRLRVAPDEPAMLCDDRGQWSTIERHLRKERRQRLLDKLADLGYERSEFRGYSWADMWDEVFDNEAGMYADAMDDGGWTPDDDTGYGPYSYFQHAMNKDD